MDDLTRQLLFYGDLSPQERRAADEALSERLASEGGDLGRALQRWQAVRRRVATRFRGDLPARPLLVRYALAEDPQGALTDAERRELGDARPRVEAALDAHPALKDVVEQIRRERGAFEAAWREHTEADASNDASFGSDSAARRAPDRSPAARGHSSGSPPKRRLLQRWGFRAGAAVAVMAFAAVLFFVAQRDLNTVTVAVAEGENPRTVELADGSTARLMPGATLSYVAPEAGAAFDRQATLEAGRAFFDIAHAQDGFVVKTPTAQVTVLGTRFGVRAEERTTRVVLAEGRVALTAAGGSGGAPVTLRPGQASRVAAGARPSTPTAVERLSEALAWTGLFVFRNTPAEVLARQLDQHYDEAAVRVAPSLAEKEVTGTFERARPLRETLGTVATALGAEVQSTPGGYRLVPGGNAP